MRTILILSIFVVLAFNANAQNKFKSTFPEGTRFFKNSNPSIELKDSEDKTILIFKKDGLEFNRTYYVFEKQKKTIALNDKIKGSSLGSISRNFRSFSFGGNDYKLSKKNRNGYNFVINDANGNPISMVKYSIFKDECTIEISNTKDMGLLPFVFLTTLNAINNNKAEMYLVYCTNFLVQN